MATGAPEFQGALVRLADALAREAKKVSTALARLDQADALDGSARRQLFNQARETVLNNAEEEPGTKWIRHARSGACGFCRMLATRALTEGHGGAPGLYNTEATASRNTHQKFEIGHDRCRCIIIPLRPGATYVPPDYLPQWLDDYYAVSRDADDRLLNPQVIADRMEAIGRERGDYGDKMHRRPVEEATNGVLVKKQFSGISNPKQRFDPINLWYCSEAKAREVMSEEMANWFDANGRITLPVMRAMILDGDENFRRRTIMTQDFNQ